MNCMSSGNSYVDLAHSLCARVGRSCFVYMYCKRDAFSLTCTCSVGDEAMPSFQPTASAVCRRRRKTRRDGAFWNFYM